MTKGQRHESTQVEAVFEQVSLPRANGRRRKYPKRLAADRGYDAIRIRHWLRAKGIHAIIPPKKRTAKRRRGRPNSYNQAYYRKRSATEQAIGWLREHRAIATRFEKLATTFLGLVKLGFIRRYLRTLTRSQVIS